MKTQEIKGKKVLANKTDAPEWVYHLAYALFEGLEIEEAKKFPLKFVSAMPVGLSSQEWDEKVKAPFLIYVLEQALETLDHDKSPDAKNAINQCIELWKRDDINSESFVWAALAAARAARTAESALDARTARVAVWAAARVAARDADWADDWAAYKNQADKLLEIMEEVRRDERSN